MGSGKTTLGRRLAKHLGCPFVDLDASLMAEQGRSIRDIMESDGEARFRRLEMEALRRHVGSAPPTCVTATGGGIVESAASHALLRQLGLVVWLRADPQECVQRLGRAARARPLLDDDAWVTRYRRREPLYRAVAARVVDTYPASIEQSLAALVRLLESEPS